MSVLFDLMLNNEKAFSVFFICIRPSPSPPNDTSKHFVRIVVVRKSESTENIPYYFMLRNTFIKYMLS